MQKKIANPSLIGSVQVNREHARELRQAARETRAITQRTMARARRLRLRVDHFDSKVEEATSKVRRQRTLRDDALDALKQSLHDLESVRVVLSGDKELDTLKADIRKTIGRAR